MVLGIFQPTLAADLLNYGSGGFSVQGNKAYLVTSSYSDDLTSQTQKIEQYDFPSLEFRNSMTLTAGADSYFGKIEANDSGIMVSIVAYKTEYTDNDDGTVTVTSTDTTTSSSYDLSFIKQAEKVTETSYSYINYPYYIDGYECPDTESARKAAARVVAKKKGGKRGGAVSCSKLKILKSRVIN